MAGLIAPAALARIAAPPIVGGSHDPLLEWALRESGSGLASLPEGSERGLRRLTEGEVIIAAIHLHGIEGDDERANLAAAARCPRTHETRVITVTKRDRKCRTGPSSGNRKARTEWRKTESADGVRLERVGGDN